MKDVHTREVEFTLTLTVTVTCGFADGAWQVFDVDNVVAFGEEISPHGFIEDFLLNNEKTCDKLASLFAQQEP